MHTKHKKLCKPQGGKYHRNEWAILGAPCSVIEGLVKILTKKLNPLDLQMGYLDMDHNPSSLDTDLHLRFTDKLSYKKLETRQSADHISYRQLYSHLDLLWVNGNHYLGTKQIVIIHDTKKDSLEKKLDRLTQVEMVIYTEEGQIPYDFLKEKLRADTCYYAISDIKGIAAHIYKDRLQQSSTMNGLVLSGGKSLRMKEDKGAIVYHEKAQREHGADLLTAYCNKVYLSVRSEQATQTKSDYRMIEDVYLGLGPYGGILSAFMQDPNTAWLTIACDLPYLDQASLDQLVTARNMSKVATCFYNPETDFPEPLITIWEPRAYPVLLAFLSQGYSCPRKVLINSDIEMVKM